jgi:hypothetical protein
MADIIKRYDIDGINSTVELGKRGNQIIANESNVSIQTNANALSPVATANGTIATNAVNLAQLQDAIGSALSSKTVTVTWNGNSTVGIGTAADDTFIHRIVVDPTETWTGATANTNITVGDSGNTSRLFSAFDVDVQVTEDAGYTYVSSTGLNAYLTQSGASAGAAKVTVWYTGIISDAALPGGGGGGGGTAGVDNVVGYDEMPPPVTAGGTLEDLTATINSPTGFTINNAAQTGIAIIGLTDSNKAFFATYGTGTKTVTWGAGSTVASSTINVVTNNPSGIPQLVFFVQGQSGAATYNYPFTFS